MRNPGGYALIVSPDASQVNFDHLRCEAVPAGNFETDTFTCGHCNRVVHVKPKMDPADIGGLCKVCMKFTCPECVGTGRCDPFEEKLKRAEDRDRVLRSYGV